MKIKYVIKLNNVPHTTNPIPISQIEDNFIDTLRLEQKQLESTLGTRVENFEKKIIARMYSTGRLDEKKIEIYSGDIVQIPDNYDVYGMNAGEKYQVYFIEGSFRLKPKYQSNIERGALGFSLDESEELTIIGTIYSNPELLQV